MRKFLKTAYVFATTALAFAAAVAPALIRADYEPNKPTTTAAGTPESLPKSTSAGQIQSHMVVSLPMRITAYSSSPDETDYDPFYTANGTYVHDGVVATNILPFGTKIQIPELFGDKVFTVEDRMAKRFQNTIDIWMTSKSAALRFGVSYANVVILIRDADDSNHGISKK